MSGCPKCETLPTHPSALFCTACGSRLAALAVVAPAEERTQPPVGPRWPIVTVEAIRSKGEGIALVAGLALFAVSWMFFDLITGVVPLFLGTVMLVLYVIYQQGALKGSGVAVSPRNFPEIDRLADDAAARLGMPKPALFIQHSRDLNAYAMGFIGPSCVVLHSEMIHATEGSPRELQFIIGHEFAHIKCAHILWQTLAAKNPIIGRIPLLSAVMPTFFSWWSRQAEFTADRGGLIACGDVTASQRALARLAIGGELFARLDIDAFIRQAYDGDMATAVSESFSSHPLLAKRILALAQFSQGPLFAQFSKHNEQSAA